MSRTKVEVRAFASQRDARVAEQVAELFDIEIDPLIPDGEIHLRIGDTVIGQLINLKPSPMAQLSAIFGHLHIALDEMKAIRAVGFEHCSNATAFALGTCEGELVKVQALVGRDLDVLLNKGEHSHD
jgi:hypothetical protein